jgi:hypothetical protein
MTTPALAENVKGKGRHYRIPSQEELIPIVGEDHPILEIAGELTPSVTNIQGSLSKPALPRWAAKVVAEQAWALRGSIGNLEEQEAIDLLKGSPWRSSTRAANRGTSIHDLLERRTLGQADIELEGEAREFMAGIDGFLEDHEIEPFVTEVTMFSSRGYAGTADFLGLFDGQLVILDYKTGKGLYPEVGLQLAALRAADVMIVDGQIKQVPRTDDGVAVLISRGGYEVKRPRSFEEDLAGFQALLEVWKWQNRDGKPLEAWDPEDPDLHLELDVIEDSP